MLCYNCKRPREDESRLLCKVCRANGVQINFPGTQGLSDGPSSGRGANQRPVFTRPDPLRETMRSLKKSEEAGKLTGKDVALARAKVEALKAQEPFRKKVDYEKDGHPLEGLKT